MDGRLRVELPRGPGGEAGVGATGLEQDPRGPPQLLHEALLPVMVDPPRPASTAFPFKSRVYMYFRLCQV